MAEAHFGHVSVHVTHIEDSVHSRQRPFIYFWVRQDFGSFSLLKDYLEFIRHYLEASSPPLNLNLLADRVCCVLINHQWHRARVPQPELSHEGTIEVICIDFGVTHAVPLTCVRTVDFPGIQAQCVREWPPLITKFFLADIVAPKGKKSGSRWSEKAMTLLKSNILNQTLQAEFIGWCDDIEGLRLFDVNNQSLAMIMIQEKLGVAAPNDRETSPELINDVAVVDLPPDPTSNPDANANCLIEESYPKDKATVTHIPQASLSSEETLNVIVAQEHGSFFGQLDKIPVKDLDDMASELKLAYSSDSNIILYADAKSHLGHYGVVQWDADENFYRIRVVEEFVNDAKVLFVDYGSYEEIPKCDIFAVFESLTCFCKSPFGIRCKIDDVTLPLADWSELIIEKKIKVKIGKCVDGIFYVTLAEDPCNNFIAKVISTKVVQSSSGLFQVNIFWQPNRPSTSAMPDANSRELSKTEIKKAARKRRNARRNANRKSKKMIAPIVTSTSPNLILVTSENLSKGKRSTDEVEDEEPEEKKKRV